MAAFGGWDSSDARSSSGILGVRNHAARGVAVVVDDVDGEPVIGYGGGGVAAAAAVAGVPLVVGLFLPPLFLPLSSF